MLARRINALYFSFVAVTGKTGSIWKWEKMVSSKTECARFEINFLVQECES